MEKGTLELTTNGGNRKMSYTLIDGVYYMSSKSQTNKIAQIKADNQVTINLEDGLYEATLVLATDSDFAKTKDIYTSSMSKVQKFVYCNLFGRKNDIFIILHKK